MTVLSGIIQVVLVTVVFGGLLWLLSKGSAFADRRLRDAAERRLQAMAVGGAPVDQASRIIERLQRVVHLAAWILALVVAYGWLTFGFRRFSYTRPWGELLRGFLLAWLSHAGGALLRALPGLFTVLVIVLLTRLVIGIARTLFEGAAEGRIKIPGVYRETAEPTRKLVTVVLWLFAVAFAYPYLPGSSSDAFKGVSVFVGLMVSLGSSGLANQLMSGLTLTYSRALRSGDYVAVGALEGTVTELGMLSTKIRTFIGEDVTIPNAVMVSQTVTNYSRLADTVGVFVPTDITIGYDTPWRQVQALLLLAATRVAGVRQDPAPFVRQAALEDPYVKYTLLFCVERPADRLLTLAAVHASILDAFNEYGVQIMSPRYVLDPAGPKVVPRHQWFAAPASPDAPVGGAQTGQFPIK
jgi:small-conductance mechanosensitive channel